jgi:hypothetical protein
MEWYADSINGATTVVTSSWTWNAWSMIVNITYPVLQWQYYKVNIHQTVWSPTLSSAKFYPLQ